MNNLFHFHFKDLGISPGEIEELMGFEPGESPEPFPLLIKEGLEMAPGYCQIKGGYQIFDAVEANQANETIRIGDQLFSPGKNVVSRFKNTSQAALFVCTAGIGISELSKQLSSKGDDLLAFVTDIIGSVTVEKAADKIQEKILEEVAPSGLGITDSFSPGYCNWSVAEQQKLFALLPPDFCGISLSESSLMNPIKSASGIIGIGTNCKQTGYQCSGCTDQQCIYGKIRRRKKAKKNL
jgi:hypothetical protein